MATKAQFTTAINAEITAVIDIPEHRASMQIVTDELWKTIVTNVQTTNDVIEKTYTNGVYTFRLRKVGNCVDVNYIVSVFSTSTLQAGSVFATIVDAEFLPKTGGVFYISGTELGTTNGFSLNFQPTTGYIKNMSPMSPTKQYVGNGFYFTND